jgi:hypothetical protein
VQAVFISQGRSLLEPKKCADGRGRYVKVFHFQVQLFKGGFYGVACVCKLLQLDGNVGQRDHLQDRKHVEVHFDYRENSHAAHNNAGADE